MIEGALYRNLADTDAAFASKLSVRQGQEDVYVAEYELVAIAS